MTQDVVAATLELTTALEAENAALVALDLVAAAQLLDRKEAATTAFTEAQRRAVTARATVDTKALRLAAIRLKTATEENRKLLERAIGVQNRVLGILAQAARKADPLPRYGRSGVYAQRPAGSWALSASA